MNDYDVSEQVWDYDNSCHDFYESYDLDDEYERDSNENYQELAYRHYA
tara:strand:- start:272 stop:415 length:144 start_codon:yes stop_codon:yes gene_type:complete